MSDLYPGSYQIPPMRYHNKLSDKVVDSAMINGEWMVQKKYDGSFYQLERTLDGSVYLFGRTLSKKTNEYTEKIANVPHIKEWAENHLPKGTVLLGEIYVPDGHSNDTTKIMGCLPQKAIERQKKQGYVEYHIFDCLYWKNENLCDVPFGKRYFSYIEPLYDFQNEYITFIPAYVLKEGPASQYGIIAKTKSNDEIIYDDNLQRILNNCFANNGEGAVFKRYDMIYEPDKRPMSCFKMKQHVDSIDLVVMGLLDPERLYTGKNLENWIYWEDGTAVTKPYYYGWKNAILLGAYDSYGDLIEVGRVASGLTDELRADMAKNPNNYIGKVVECECMSLNNKDFTLRHPCFIRMREDKNPSECLLKEIFA